ncbi:hypothetical protein EVAR_19654_1 [Eumeta japonica]|uniref:Uncharacterized protein n=1 Tax=Eumeta variegata TaxID=151549 RepID=A0A4C1V1Y4_EUMVA|nr:hypothetical protein EVAR_19654_1 [Eumeta japonica]
MAIDSEPVRTGPSRAAGRRVILITPRYLTQTARFPVCEPAFRHCHRGLRVRAEGRAFHETDRGRRPGSETSRADRKTVKAYEAPVASL